MPPDKKTETINGSQIVGRYDGTSTGEIIYRTADGRTWKELRGGVPATLPTGAILSTIKSN